MSVRDADVIGLCDTADWKWARRRGRSINVRVQKDGETIGPYSIRCRACIMIQPECETQIGTTYLETRWCSHSRLQCYPC
jgi:hypothetical protein